MSPESQPSIAKAREENPLTPEELEKIKTYLNSHTAEAREILKRIVLVENAQTTGIPAELGNLENFGDFLKERLAGGDELAIALVQEMKNFIDKARMLKIDGTNSTESMADAQKIAEVISELSKKLYQLFYSETEQEALTKHNTYLIDTNFAIKNGCYNYLGSRGIKGIVISFVLDDARFDTNSMKSLGSETGNRFMVKKSHSWTVKYVNTVLQHALVDTY